MKNYGRLVGQLVSKGGWINVMVATLQTSLDHIERMADKCGYHPGGEASNGLDGGRRGRIVIGHGALFGRGVESGACEQSGEFRTEPGPFNLLGVDMWMLMDRAKGITRLTVDKGN